MSKTMTADAIAHDQAAHNHGNMARRSSCPDCDDRTVIFILGEEMPCPGCQPVAYEETRRDRAAGF